MTTNPYSLRCPVCRRQVVADDRGRCPVCEVDLTPIVGWRVHGASLYNQGLEACSEGRWDVAAVMLEQARAFAPDAANVALLLGKVYARLGRVEDARVVLDDALRLGAGEASVRPALDGLASVKGRSRQAGAQWRPIAGLAGLALVVVAMAAGGYQVGALQQPSPRVVEVRVTLPPAVASPIAVPTSSAAAQTPVAAPSPSPKPSPTAPPPSPTPSPTATPCPSLEAQLAARWATTPALRLARLRPQVDGCAVRIGGSAATAYVIDVALAAARAAGAAQIDIGGITVTQQYTVRPGDTLWSIARVFYGNPYRYVDIIRANAGLPPDLRQLRAGQGLRMPPLAPP